MFTPNPCILHEQPANTQLAYIKAAVRIDTKSDWNPLKIKSGDGTVEFLCFSPDIQKRAQTEIGCPTVLDR